MAGLFTEEELEKPWQELSKKLSQKAKEMFEDSVRDHALNLIFAVTDCESPIEEIMALAFENFTDRCVDLADDGCYFVESQYEINCSNRKFRVDFFVTAIVDNKNYKIIVECDGHDFHEKTKAQAARDKQRDRILTRNGYTVLHFTGSEIYSDPYRCAREVLNIIFPSIRR